MELHTLNEYWEWMDILKTFLSLAVGFLLGFEREQKDKAAGLRTISIICLGSTLFTILSYKMGMGASEDSTRIASYVVSGIGFLGAGVIFKDGFSINGLTTASIIWAAAAIGMAIGFGEFFIALAFLVATLFTIHVGNYINNRFFSKLSIKILVIIINKTDYEKRHLLVQDLQPFCNRILEKQIEADEERVKLTLQAGVFTKSKEALEQFLINQPYIQSFSL